MDANYTLTVKVNGRLDTANSSELDGALADIMSSEKISEIRFDFSDLEYIASSGLRVLLAALKKVTPLGGTVHILNANDSVMEILTMTGFDTIFVIE